MTRRFMLCVSKFLRYIITLPQVQHFRIMSFSSRRRNYLLTPHRRDGLIEWMKSMLMHSFVLDALDTTGAETFSHFEDLIDEHRRMEHEHRPSRLQQLVPTVGTFHTHLPLKRAFLAYNEKHKITKRRHICISFNELRHILNLAQIMAMRTNDEDLERDPNTDADLNDWALSSSLHVRSTSNVLAETPPTENGSEVSRMLSAAHTSDIMDNDDTNNGFNGPQLITFDGDQTLYSDGANFESNPKLANYLYLLLKHGVTIAVVTAAGYEYQTKKYELRLSGLLDYFQSKGLSEQDCDRFYLFGGECNYLLRLGPDYRLHPVKEEGPGGWMTSTKYLPEAPGNWNDDEVDALLNVAEKTVQASLQELNLRGKLIRKKRSIGLVPSKSSERIPREGLDETVLRVVEDAQKMNQGAGPSLPYCAFNGGSDVWLDVGNKRVGVQVLQSYLGISSSQTLHIGDQFLNTGNDFAARDVCACVWITSPEETTYILKSILRLAGISLARMAHHGPSDSTCSPLLTSSSHKSASTNAESGAKARGNVDFVECARRTQAIQKMDVYTGEIIQSGSTASLQSKS